MNLEVAYMVGKTQLVDKKIDLKKLFEAMKKNEITAVYGESFHQVTINYKGLVFNVYASGKAIVLNLKEFDVSVAEDILFEFVKKFLSDGS